MSQQINLFNPVFLKQKKVFTVVPMAQALGVLLLGSLAMVFYGSQRVAALERDANAFKAQLAAKEARQKAVSVEFAPRLKSKTLEAQLEQTDLRLRSLRTVSGILKRGELGNTAGYAEYFRAFSRQNIHGLWLTGLSISGAGNEIGVQGRAMYAPLIPQYISRLTGETVMRGKTFGSLEIAQPAAADQPKSDTPLPAIAPFVEFRLQTTGAGALANDKAGSAGGAK